MPLQYPTPHIAAKPEDFAETVLMPGDPKRSKFIAENYLENAVLINDVRGVQGYTGFYNNKRVSVMASGMGIPSMAIYSYELFNIFGVENIIRIGSAGSYSENVRVRDIVLAQGACTDSNYLKHFSLPGSFAPIADFKLLRRCAEIAEQSSVRFHIGNIVSSDVFYGDNSGMPEYKNPVKSWSKMGVLAVEMETAALYANAARSGKNALTILTVSDNLITGEETTAEERESTFTEMMEIALKTAVSI